LQRVVLFRGYEEEEEEAAGGEEELSRKLVAGMEKESALRTVERIE